MVHSKGLLYTCLVGDVDTLKGLLEGGATEADVYRNQPECDDEMNCLMCAAKAGNLRIVEALLAWTTTPWLVNELSGVHGRTALMFAVLRCHYGMVRFLAQHSAVDVNKHDKYFLTPLVHATLANDPVCAMILLENGADPHSTVCGGKYEGMTALQIARDNALDAVLSVLEAGGQGDEQRGKCDDVASAVDTANTAIEMATSSARALQAVNERLQEIMSHTSKVMHELADLTSTSDVSKEMREAAEVMEAAIEEMNDATRATVEAVDDITERVHVSATTQALMEEVAQEMSDVTRAAITAVDNLAECM